MKTRKSLVLFFLTFMCHGAVWAVSDPDYVEGINLSSNNRCRQAVPFFERVIQRDPKNYDAIYRLAVCYEQNLDPEKAVETFSKLDKVSDRYPNLQFSIAKNFYTMKEYEKANKYFEFSERRGYNPEGCRYFRAHILFAQEKYDEAEALFRKLSQTVQTPLFKQGSLLYIALIAFDRENPHFKKNKFQKAKVLFKKTIEMDARSNIAESARIKLAEIDKLLGVEPPQPSKLWSASLSEDTEFDTNTLNENNNTVTKTNAKTVKLNLVGDIKYKLYNHGSFYFHPAFSLNSSYYQPTDQNDYASVKTSNSIVATATMNMGSSFPDLLDMEKYVDVAYPIKVATTFNDANGDDTWGWNTIALSLSPSWQYQLIKGFFTSFNMDYTYTFNDSKVLNSQSFKAGGSQSFNTIPKILDFSLGSDVTYTWDSNDNVAVTAKPALTWQAPLELSTSLGFNYTYTHHYILTSRGNENKYEITASVNRVFSEIFALNLHYNYIIQKSGATSSEYNKHKFGLKLTFSW